LRFHETEIRVRFYEADMWEMGWHGHFVGWFEAGRIELARKFDLLPARFTELGYFAPVINLNIDYKTKARFDDVITIRTAVRVPTKAALTFEYQAMRKEDGALLAKGETTQVLLNKKGELVYVIPEALQGRIEEMVRFCNPVLQK
jgi:acyl-CoA thioester hydrolase